MGWTECVERMGEKRHVYWVLVGKPEFGRPLGRARLRWDVNIKMSREGTGWGLRGDKLAGSYKPGNKPSGSIQCGDWLYRGRTGQSVLSPT